MADRIRAVIIAATLVFCAAYSSHASADVPSVLHFSGRLTTDGGGFTGSISMTFKLYTSSTAQTSFWSETLTVDVDADRFHVVLGNNTTLDPSSFSGGSAYLGLAVASDPEMTPRVLLASTPYAFHSGDAKTVGGSLPSAFSPATHDHDGTYVNVADAAGWDQDSSDDLTTATTFSGDVSGTSANLALGTTVVSNTHVSATAAIAGTKISANFGAQDVVTTGNLGVGIAAPTANLDVASSGAVSAKIRTTSGSSQSTTLEIHGARTSSTVEKVATVAFHNNESGGPYTMAQITSLNADGTSGTTLSDLVFSVNDGTDATTLTEAVRIDHQGRLGVGVTDPRALLSVDTVSTTDSSEPIHLHVSGTQFMGFNLHSDGSGGYVRDVSATGGAKIHFTGNQITVDLVATDNTIATPLTMMNSGRVGVNLASGATPGDTLDVAGGIKATGFNCSQCVDAADIAVDAVGGAAVQDGSLTLSDVGQSGCATGQTAVWDGSVWACNSYVPMASQRVCPKNTYLLLGYCAPKTLHYTPKTNCTDSDATLYNGVCYSFASDCARQVPKTALTTCSGLGGRLCTPAELDRLLGSGCSFDNGVSWTQFASSSANMGADGTGIGLCVRSDNLLVYAGVTVDTGGNTNDEIAACVVHTTFKFADTDTVVDSSFGFPSSRAAGVQCCFD
jgi:hypothetical protein